MYCGKLLRPKDFADVVSTLFQSSRTYSFAVRPKTQKEPLIAAFALHGVCAIMAFCCSRHRLFRYRYSTMTSQTPWAVVRYIFITFIISACFFIRKHLSLPKIIKWLRSFMLNFYRKLWNLWSS